MTQNKNTISVDTLLTLYANSLSSTLDGNIIVLEGFYSDNNGNVVEKGISLEIERLKGVVLLNNF